MTVMSSVLIENLNMYLFPHVHEKLVMLLVILF